MTAATKTYINAKGPWPVSWDGKKAVRCDGLGNADLRGRYCYWYEKDADGFEVKRIARLKYPERKQEPLSLDKMKEEITGNPKMDMRLPKTQNKMRARLVSVLGRLGIQYTDALNITHVTKTVEVAAWGMGEKENDEYILINPYILSQRKTFVSYIMQHEIMHRALYRGRKHLGDRDLLNVVLDACIHRILASNANGRPNKHWIKFCNWIYPEESKKTVLAICNAAMTEKDLRELGTINPKFVEIWRDLYNKYTETDVEQVKNPKTGVFRNRTLKGLYNRKIKTINPDDLYFRLKNQLSDKDREAIQDFAENDGLNPFGGSGKEVMVGGKSVILRDEVADIAPTISKRMEEAVRKRMVPKRLRGSMSWRSYCDCRTEFWDKFVKKPEDLYDDNLAEYARRIHTDKIIEDVAGRIKRKYQHDVVQKCYPEVLTEEGTIFAMLGFRPPRWPFFSNYEGYSGRKRIVSFFDVSPSTYMFWPYMCKMVDIFERDLDLVMARNNYGDSGALLFAGSVKPLDKKEFAEMRKGNIVTGASTHFNSVIEYCIDQIHTCDADAIVIFTDGESGLSPELAKDFNRSGKKAYRIYFMPENKSLQESGYQVKSSLDQLNGESYTLYCPKSDSMGWL